MHVLGFTSLGAELNRATFVLPFMTRSTLIICICPLDTRAFPIYLNPSLVVLMLTALVFERMGRSNMIACHNLFRYRATASAYKLEGCDCDSVIHHLAVL